MGSFVKFIVTYNIYILFFNVIVYCLRITVMTLPLVGPLLDNKNSYSYSYNITPCYIILLPFIYIVILLPFIYITPYYIILLPII